MRIEELIDDEEMRRKVENLSENDVVALPDLGHLPENVSFRTESYAVFLCLGGRGTCELNGRTVEIGMNDVVFVQHQQLINKVMTSVDFKGCGFLMSADYLESIFLLTGKFWPANFMVAANPVIHLNDKEMRQSIANTNFLTAKLAQPRSEHYKEMIHLLIRSMVFDFYDIVASKLQFPSYTYTSAESLFTRFMKMAEEETPRHREVGYYADRLCITPKYLSVVCKQASGKTASAILNKMTVEHIRTQLRASGKSVKEIAREAGFDNLSFFGKYVRRELGMSPREYRGKA